MSDPINPAAIIRQVEHPEVQEACDNVRKSFGEFRTQWANALQRAVENGRAVGRLQLVCQRKGVEFVKTLEACGIPTTTAYANRDLASVWDRAKELITSAGADADGYLAEFKSARELYLFVNPPAPQVKPKKDKPDDKPDDKKPEGDKPDDGQAADQSGQQTEGTTSNGTTSSEPTGGGFTPDDVAVAARIAELRATLVSTRNELAALGAADELPPTPTAKVRPVKLGASVRVGSQTFKITEPTLLLPE